MNKASISAAIRAVGKASYSTNPNAGKKPSYPLVDVSESATESVCMVDDALRTNPGHAEPLDMSDTETKTPIKPDKPLV